MRKAKEASVGVKLPPGYELVLKSRGPIALKGVEVMHYLSLVDEDLRQRRRRVGNLTEPVMQDLFQHAVFVAAEALGGNLDQARPHDEVGSQDQKAGPIRERLMGAFEFTSKFTDVVAKISSIVDKTS